MTTPRAITSQAGGSTIPLRSTPPRVLSRSWLEVLAGVALVVTAVVALDAVAYRLLPERYLVPFKDYRRPATPTGIQPGGWLVGYFKPDPVSGFDMQPNAKVRYVVERRVFDAWSNSLGCFDREHSPDSAYVYFGGDSFTWGYAAYDDKFGTVVEKSTGVPVFKCGVEHTGQLHQFSKLEHTVANFHKKPKAVFVFAYENDVADDYAYPHSTVIDGWLVDTVAVNEKGDLIRLSPMEVNYEIGRTLRGVMARHRADSVERNTFPGQLRLVILRYSLTANVLTAGLQGIGYRMRLTRAAKSPRMAGDRHLRNFKRLEVESNGRYWYTSNPFARANKDALLAMQKWSEEKQVPLVFVLIPPRKQTFSPEFYTELKNFLAANNFRFLDLGSVFAAQKVRPRDLYWREDIHFNPAGNAMVARVLVDSFPNYLGNSAR